MELPRVTWVTSEEAAPGKSVACRISFDPGVSVPLRRDASQGCPRPANTRVRRNLTQGVM